MSKSKILVKKIHSISDALERIEKERMQKINNLNATRNASLKAEKDARKALSDKFENDKRIVNCNLKDQLQKIEQFRNVIKKNKDITPQNAVSIYNDMVRDPAVTSMFQEERPDWNDLNELQKKVGDTTLWGNIKKVFSWGGYRPQKEMVKDLVFIIENGFIYADSMKQFAIETTKKRLKSLQNNYNNEISAREKAYESKCRSFDNSENDINKKYYTNLKTIIEGESISSLRNYIISIAAELSIVRDKWVTYTKPKKRAKEIGIGMQGENIFIPKNVQKIVKQKLGAFCTVNPDKKNTVISIPLAVSLNAPIRMYVKHSEHTKAKVVEGIQSVLSKLIKNIPPGEFDITYIDPIDRGSNLGVLQKLTSDKLKGGVIFRSIASSREEINDALKGIQSEIDFISRSLGKRSSMYEYNAQNKKKMINHYIVINDYPKNFTQISYDAMEVILNNADKCGVSVIICATNKVTEKNDEPFIKLLESAVKRSPFINVVETDKHFYIVPQKKPFKFETMQEVTDDFLKSVQDNYDTRIKLNNSYKERVLDNGAGTYIEQGDVLTVPYAVNEENKVVTLTVGSKNTAHSMITGKNGSGKTTALHTIINSIVWNYSPNAVNLWLIDYAKVEFAKYTSLEYPHIKMIGLENSIDFSYGLLDELQAESVRRTEKLYSVRASSVFEYNQKQSDPSKKIPRLVVIIDEFHNLSNHIIEDRRTNKATGLSYKTLLEQLMLEIRKLGISLFFSDQSVTEGLRGFTSKAQAQVHNWIAMMNTPDDINIALGLSSGKYTDDQKYFIIKNRAMLAPGDVLIGEVQVDDNGSPSQAVVHKYKVLYSQEEDAKLIANRSKKRFGEKYQPLIIDSNKRHLFNKNKIATYEKQYPLEKDVFCPVYLGTTPANLDRCFRLNLKASSSNNLMLIGSNNELKLSILKSVVRCFLRYKSNSIVIWADSNDIFYQNVKNELQEIAAKTKDVFKIYDTDEQICRDVLRLKTGLENGKQQNRMTIAIGIEDLYDNFSCYSEKPPDINFVPISKKQKKAKNSHDVYARLADVYNYELAMVDGTASDESDIINMETEKENETYDMRYDARKDIAYIQTRGPKRTHFFFLLLDQVLGLEKIRRSVDIGNFYHKLALKMSTDESMTYLGKPQFASSLSSISAVYTYGGGDVTEFKPYE